MPVKNIFDRTACFVKEPLASGKVRIRRLPWDLISSDEVDNMGFSVSPIPVNLNFDSRAETAAYQMDIIDMLSDPSNNDEIDNVTKFEFFESEAAFYAKFEGVFGFYTGDTNQSAEFGY